MRRRFTGIERAHFLAISTILDPRMKKLAFSNREAGRQAEQWIIQEANTFIPVESNSITPEVDKSGETPDVNKPACLWHLFDKKLLIPGYFAEGSITKG